MIRLAEARARAELRDRVTVTDAQDVVEVMKFSLWETYQDEMGGLDFERSQHGTGMSKKGEPKRYGKSFSALRNWRATYTPLFSRFVTQLHKLAEQSGNNRYTYDNLYQVAQGMD